MKNKKLNETKDKKKVSKYSKRELTVYLVLRVLVIVVMIRQIFLGEWNNVFLCVLTLILFLVPLFIEKQINVKLPDALQVIILLFIFSDDIL